MKKITAKQPTGITTGNKVSPEPTAGTASSSPLPPSKVRRATKTPITMMDAPETAPKPTESTALSHPVPTSLPVAPAVNPEKPKPATRRRPTKSASPVEIPSILLEGDSEPVTILGGPGEKYSLGARPPTQNFSGGELPESYGTRKLFLTARDPHWLYAHWDLTREQQNEYNNLSTDGHLVLRIFAGKIAGHAACEIHVHPESRHWFAHVEQAGTSYAAELGYYSSLGQWIRVAVSSGTVTPPDAAAPETEAEFATIPFEFPFPKLMHIVEEAVRDNAPLALAIEELRRHGHPELPRFSSTGISSVPPAPAPTPESPTSPEPDLSAAPGLNSAPTAPKSATPVRVWTPEQERALARIIKIDETRRVWMGSLEITELIRRRLMVEASSPVAGFTSPAGYVPGGVSSALAAAGLSGPGSSPAGPAEKPKGFWFNVNAELIIYGATEPGAKVTLGGHEIKLRADGTFSFRFSLPDGKYDLPAMAISADGTDARAAELRFSRQTEYRGDVGAHPQDPALKPPVTDNL